MGKKHKTPARKAPQSTLNVLGGLPFLEPVPDATYECLTCSYEWRGFVGPTACPVCGGLYLEWLNYTHPEELLGQVPGSKYLQNKDIYLRSEETVKPVPLGKWRIA